MNISDRRARVQAPGVHGQHVHHRGGLCAKSGGGRGEEIPEEEIFRTVRTAKGELKLVPRFNREGGLESPRLNRCMELQMASELIQAINRGIIRDDAGAEYHAVAPIHSMRVITALLRAFPGARIEMDDHPALPLYLYGDEDGKPMTVAAIARKLGKSESAVREALTIAFGKLELDG